MSVINTKTRWSKVVSTCPDTGVEKHYEIKTSLVENINELMTALIKVNDFIEKNHTKNYMVELLRREVPEIKDLINKCK